VRESDIHRITFEFATQLLTGLIRKIKILGGDGETIVSEPKNTW
jgi:hypothetical protein